MATEMFLTNRLTLPPRTRLGFRVNYRLKDPRITDSQLTQTCKQEEKRGLTQLLFPSLPSQQGNVLEENMKPQFFSPSFLLA